MRLWSKAAPGNKTQHGGGRREITPFSGELGKLNLGRFMSLQEAVPMAKENQSENLTRPAEIACLSPYLVSKGIGESRH